MKILIIQQKMIGDVLTSSMMFEALRQKYPNSQLDYLINSHTFPVVENNPFINEFIFFTPQVQNNKIAFLRFLKNLKQKKYDVIVDVYGKLSSNLITLFSKSKFKIGYHKPQSSFIYTHPIKRKTKPDYNASLAIENRMLLLEPLNVSFKVYKPSIYLSKTEIEHAKNYLKHQNIDLNKPLFMISVLGSSLAKSYPFEYMAKLLDAIIRIKPNAQILFNYLPKQKQDVELIFDLCKKSTQDNIFIDVYGKSLREFLAITFHCNTLIGNEGGANNMAKALNISTFTIFSPHLNKQNWFGNIESDDHVAVHINDYMEHTNKDRIEAKKNPERYYLKLKPELIIPKLNSFLVNFE